jgi:hypothetical protein
MNKRIRKKSFLPGFSFVYHLYILSYILLSHSFAIARMAARFPKAGYTTRRDRERP